MRSIGLIVGAACIFTVSCVGRDEASSRLSVQQFRDHATYTVNDQSGGTPIADAVGVHPMGPDSILIIDSVDPFFRFYGRDGTWRSEVGGKGEGPGEVTGPSRGAVLGDTLAMLDRGNGRLVFLSLNGYSELRRHDVPSGVVALFNGCGGLAAIVQLVRPEKNAEQANEPVQNYTIARFDSGSWRLLRGEWPSMDFVPSPQGFGVGVRDDQVAIYNYFHSRIELLSCETGVVLSATDVPYPTNWRIPPRPKGIGWIDDGILAFYSGATRVLQDTTYMVSWRPGRPVNVATVNGRLDLQLLNDAGAWLIDNDVTPVPFFVPAENLLQLLPKN